MSFLALTEPRPAVRSALAGGPMANAALADLPKAMRAVPASGTDLSRNGLQIVNWIRLPEGE